MFSLVLQSVQQACNGSYWNATGQTCIAELQNVYDVLPSLYLHHLCRKLYHISIILGVS